MNTESVACALNRIADALFSLAKSQEIVAQQNTRSVDLQVDMLNMQRVHMAVSQALEEALLTQRADSASPAN